MFIIRLAAAACLLAALPALAVLPKPTPQQAQEAAAKKAKAAIVAEKDKQLLIASMDALSARWRGRAASEGWQVHAPVAVAAPAPAMPQPAPQGSAAGQPAPGAAVKTDPGGAAAPGADVNKAPPSPRK